MRVRHAKAPRTISDMHLKWDQPVAGNIPLARPYPLAGPDGRPREFLTWEVSSQKLHVSSWEPEGPAWSRLCYWPETLLFNAIHHWKICPGLGCDVSSRVDAPGGRAQGWWSLQVWRTQGPRLPAWSWVPGWCSCVRRRYVQIWCPSSGLRAALWVPENLLNDLP